MSVYKRQLVVSVIAIIFASSVVVAAANSNSDTKSDSNPDSNSNSNPNHNPNPNPNPNHNLDSKSDSKSENSDGRRKALLSVTEKVIVKARPEFLWWSVHEARTKEPGYASSKILSQTGDCSVLSQVFTVPILGEVTCILALTDIPPGRSDYTLIQSDSFTKFDGSWTLTPRSDGQSMELGLSCDACTKKVVPQFILRFVIAKKVKERLDFVKSLAEQKEVEAQTAESAGKRR